MSERDEVALMHDHLAEFYTPEQRGRIDRLAACLRTMIEADELIGRTEFEAAMTLVVAEQSVKP